MKWTILYHDAKKFSEKARYRETGGKMGMGEGKGNAGEPIRHHYIPQFILRNFCFNDRGDLFYYDKENSKTSVKNTRDIFMVRNLYRDEINNL